MTQAGYRHRIIVQDRSGSMESILAGAQSGLDEFLRGEDDAHGTGKVTVSIWDFDTEIRCVHSFELPGEVRGYQIRPRGATNLYGAVGMAIVAEGEKLTALPEDRRPEDVTVLVASDGEHNTTIEYTGQQVAAMLKRQQEEFSWRVLYMGCGAEAFAEGERMGTHHGLTVNTAHSNTGQQKAWKMSSDYLVRVPVASAAVAMGQSIDLTPEERSLGESGDEEPTRQPEG